MTWNPKALKQNRNRQKSGLDELDRQAEAEGSAARYFKENELGSRLGKRIAKQTQQLNGRRKTADKKATEHVVAQTAKALADRQVA